jgi:hypothetical protein
MNFRRLITPFAVAAALLLGVQALRAQSDDFDPTKMTNDVKESVKDPGASLVKNMSNDSTWQIRLSDRLGSWVQLKIYAADDDDMSTPLKVLDGAGQVYKLTPKTSVKMVLAGSKKAKGYAVHCNVSFDRIKKGQTKAEEDLARMMFSHAIFKGKIASTKDLLAGLKALKLPVPPLPDFERAALTVKKPESASDYKNRNLELDPKGYTRAEAGVTFLTLK